MTVSVEGLGPLKDFARAIGLVDASEQLDATWFSDPAGHVGKMLRDPGQRDALISAANGLSDGGAPPITDAAGRHWLKLVAYEGVAFHLVLVPTSSATELGVGMRLACDDPEATATVFVPLLNIPTSGPATVVLGTAQGQLEVAADVTFKGGPPAPGDAGLSGILLTAAVATDGSAPSLSVTLRGLQLPR